MTLYRTRRYVRVLISYDFRKAPLLVRLHPIHEIHAIEAKNNIDLVRYKKADIS